MRTQTNPKPVQGAARSPSITITTCVPCCFWLQHWAGVYVTLKKGDARDIVVKGYQPCCHKLVPCLHPDITPLVPLEGSKHDITFEDIQKAYLRANRLARLGKFLLYTIPVAQLILAIVITTQSSACWVRRVRGLHCCHVAF